MGFSVRQMQVGPYQNNCIDTSRHLKYELNDVFKKPLFMPLFSAAATAAAVSGTKARDCALTNSHHAPRQLSASSSVVLSSSGKFARNTCRGTGWSKRTLE